MQQDIYDVYFDGSCWPNPGGIAHYGFTVSMDGQEICAEHGPVGEGSGMSNNVAEHVALRKALDFILINIYANAEFPKHYYNIIINIYGDSQLVINQVHKKWKAQSSKLYYNEYLKTMKSLERLAPYVDTINAFWIPREQNQRCDDLSKGDK